ncbi:MAG: hypothetical protein E7637_03880 [Ruminococcaceae bacterium]|nr:hypothetical protein [Oscillospiraceae bacterium]
MDSLKICMLAVLGLFSLSVIKQWKAEFSPLLRVALVLLCGGVALGAISPVLSYLADLIGKENGTYFEVLLKALGIAFLTQYAAELCRACGEGGLAHSVELVGKIEILLLCIPLMEKILHTAESLLSVGGAS